MSIFASIPRARYTTEREGLEEELSFMWDDNGPTRPVVNSFRNGWLVSSAPLPLGECALRAAIALESGANAEEVAKWLELARQMSK